MGAEYNEAQQRAQAAYDQRNKTKGMGRLFLMVPEESKEKFKALAALERKQFLAKQDLED